MKSSLGIGRVMGIPIKLHITFLLVLPMFAYVFAINPQPFGFAGVEPPLTRYAFSALAAIFFLYQFFYMNLHTHILQCVTGSRLKASLSSFLEEYLPWKKCPENLDRKQRWLLPDP